MISFIYSNVYPITTLWDPGSDMTLTTHCIAKHLGLKGKKNISLEVTKVGNICNKFETLEYNVPLNDHHGKIHNVRVCGISEITSEARPVDTSVAFVLGVQSRDIARPHGKIDLLIGTDYCKLFPSVLQTVGNLELMQGPFRYSIRGSHPLLKVDSINNSHVCVRVNHMAGVSYVNDLHVEPKESVTKRLQAFFDVENLVIYCNPKCDICKCGMST